MNTEQNAKWQHTEDLIKDAFLELLKTKPLEELTISDLCRKAGINRTTFYSHFSTIKEIQDKLENDAIHVVLEHLLSADDDPKEIYSYRNIYEVVQFVKDKDVFRKHFIPSYDPTKLMEKIGVIIRQKYHMEPNSMEQSIFNFCGIGLMGSIALWVKNGCQKSCEELALELEHMIKRTYS